MTESLPSVNIGGVVVPITEPLFVQPVFGAVLTEGRIVGNVFCFSFADVVQDMNGSPQARIVARLRVPLETMAFLHTSIGRLMGQTEQGKKVAN